MSIKIGVASIGVLALSGCAVANKIESMQAQKTYDQAVAECHARFSARPAVPMVKCINEARTRLGQAPGADPDLLAVVNGKALVAAEKYDAGTITEGEFDTAIAQAKAEYTTGSLNRWNEETLARSAAVSAAAAASPTTCRRSGNTVTCY